MFLGAGGLLAVLSAEQLGAERIVLMDRYKSRAGPGRFFGAADVIAGHGHEGITRIRELTGVTAPCPHPKPPGTWPHQMVPVSPSRRSHQPRRCPAARGSPVGFGSLFGPDATLTGPAPTRTCMDELLPAVPGGVVEPGRVSDRTGALEQIPGGCGAMEQHEALKVLVTP
ncbi:hypothetical protein [Streptomyces sp. NPDC014623]|uniref:hypothetical protein n=1 Tax=Streptomyces sp. NPDC014623 TaxID=3364875 RepID=UPI0036FF8C3E